MATSARIQPGGDGPMRFDATQPEYGAVLDKRFNKRFISRPDCVYLVSTTDHVIAAVQQAVSDRLRVVVTSGGHCLEGFVSDPDVRVIIDVSPMKRVYYDLDRRAVAIEAGATVGEAFRALHDSWGTVVPLGEYPGVGIGGHVAGGAFGFLCRQLGLAADYLYAIEIVVVDDAGVASAVVATREASDPRRDLWWAHTGAGGGNLGIVTRYWFRTHDAMGNDPSALLPAAPDRITTFETEWSWHDLDRQSFRRLLGNHGDWSEHHSGAESPNASLFTLLSVHRRQLGRVVLRGVSTAGASAQRQIRDYLAALSDGLAAPPAPVATTMSWLEFALNPFPELFGMPPGGVSVKVKDALLKKRLTAAQIDVAYDYLTRDDHDVVGGMLGLATYGGRVNALATDATASAHRSSIFDLACTTGWQDPADEARNVVWVRAFYRDLFGDTGGVPVPGDRYDGALINHPDVDLADPAWNTSGQPWHAIYYQSNYERLQQVKARWDPRNVFRHALSVQAGSRASWRLPIGGSA